MKVKRFIWSPPSASLKGSSVGCVQHRMTLVKITLEADPARTRRTCNCKSWNTFFQILLSCSVIIDWAIWLQKVYYLWWRRRRLSVTRGLDYLLNIWLFTSVKINPIALKNCLSRLKICQLLQNGLRLWKYCQSGEISPNLVTLRGFCDVEYLTKTKADFLLMIR